MSRTSVAPAALAAFRNPAAAFRPAPFLVFNDEYAPGTGEASITRALEGLKRVGAGGVFLHPRPGLITEYLSPRWFEIIRHAIRECLRLGMVPSLYDENSYPSACGGGHTQSMAPEARNRYVKAITGNRVRDLPERIVSLYRFDGEKPTVRVTAAELKSGDAWVAFTENDQAMMSWHGETTTPCLVDPRVAPAFLENTFERYKKELGPLWKKVGAMFTDEPHLPGEWHGPLSPGLSLTPYVFGQFQTRRGYDLRDHLDALFYDVGDYQSVRHDFYDLMHTLWVENYAKPTFDWCRENGIPFTGHFLEHDWPCPFATPGHVHLSAFFDWPGTDLLLCDTLLGRTKHDWQNFYPTKAGQEPLALLYLRQTLTVANQYARPRIMDESWGAGGNDSTPHDWLRIGRFLAVHGVSVFVPHLTYTTIRGPRKADHPQTFSPHSPWFEHLTPVHDEIGRLSWVAAQGRMENRVLVLDQQTTAFLHATKSTCTPAPRLGDEPAEDTQAAHLRRLSSFAPFTEAMGNFSQALNDAQIDFDYGDEYILEEQGRTLKGGKMKVGAQTYALIVWPAKSTNLRRATAELLEKYLANGGVIVGQVPDAVTIDGRPSDWLLQTRRRWPKGFVVGADDAATIDLVRERVAPRLQFAAGGRHGCTHMRRVSEDGEWWMIFNASHEALSETVTLLTRSGVVTQLDPRDGESRGLSVEKAGTGAWRVALEIAPWGAVVLHVAKTGAARAASPAVAERAAGASTSRSTSVRAAAESARELELVAVEREGRNVCAIDYCSLEAPGLKVPPTEVNAVNEKLWRAHGFMTNGWMGVIQYRRQMLARNDDMVPTSGGVARYTVEVRRGAELRGAELAVETPELWDIAVNGKRLDFAKAALWRDDANIRRAPVGRLLREGKNEIVLTGHPFDVRREIDRLLLLGDFGCVSAKQGFALAPTRALKLGSWREQGLPFYDGEVAYRFALPKGASRGELVIGAHDWAGSLIVVEQGGERVARLLEAPFAVQLDAAQGREVTLRVVGLPKNVLGPWHFPRKERKCAGPYMWRSPEVVTEPQPGEKYDLLDLGLFAAPQWRALE
ncbi:hypothetical protein K0B96_11415 [Horticoccus luteus]|uniref:Alpha-L-rhamnosidase-like protein n=1 Tax=Horticoccus luteus TaxID=2862869 RepID=A0A8F9XK77_9BACT|nr:hypothetical protein [Horticoccus luteus]QYM77921.1 hypothetical protein K0B96_11415 [Horticoccus luteus]